MAKKIKSEKLMGLRIITNLHCNYNCNFCYQKRKTKDILKINILKVKLKNYPKKYFEYCTIMGGESTLLDNLDEYIKLGKKYSKQVRLTTNGSLITKELLKKYKNSGLNGINISIATLEKYKEVTKGNLTKKQILKKVILAKKIFPDLRINIALFEYNMRGEIKKLVSYFVSRLKLNITVCESFSGKFSCLNNPEDLLDSKIIKDTGYGLIILEHNKRKFGYYSHKDNYKHTDLVVTPLGTWKCWDNYCKAVDPNLNKYNGGKNES